MLEQRSGRTWNGSLRRASSARTIGFILRSVVNFFDYVSCQYLDSYYFIRVRESLFRTMGFGDYWRPVRLGRGPVEVMFRRCINCNEFVYPVRSGDNVAGRLQKSFDMLSEQQ